MTVKIDTIKLTIGEKEIELSIAEARELKKALNDLLAGAEGVPSWYPIFIKEQNPYPYRPYFPSLWCSTSGNVSLSTSGSTSSYGMMANNALDKLKVL